jgi:23S rRNA (cytosine1962-C5)-methyltransferase
VKTRLPGVALGKRLERAIRGGHPWVYRDAVAGTPRLPDGAVVQVTTRNGSALAVGFWDARSPIAVRILGDGPRVDPNAFVEAQVAAALARRLAFIDRRETDTFRWIHGEADGLPGVHVDVYGEAASVRFDGGGAREFYLGTLGGSRAPRDGLAQAEPALPHATNRDLPARLSAAAGAAGVSLRTVVERRRARGGAGAQGGTGAEERTAVVLGDPPAGELEVRENGLRFGVDLLRGQKGGLFLDQRDNRALVRTLAPGRRVLNLFGYTGGFSIYAAAGGASATVTVDAAAPAIAAARRNFERNGLALDDAGFVAGDAFGYLEQAARRGERFDLVISDPPSFAPNRRALTAGLRAYQRLHRLCAAITAPGGTLCAASCSSHVDRAAFLATVRDGARDAGRRFELREMRGAGPDHPVVAHFPEGDYLKFAVGVL